MRRPLCLLRAKITIVKAAVHMINMAGDVSGIDGIDCVGLVVGLGSGELGA